MADSSSRLAVVTGASSGIGAATARALARAGFVVDLGARREGRIKPLAEEIGGHARFLDVTDHDSVASFGMDGVFGQRVGSDK